MSDADELARPGLWSKSQIELFKQQEMSEDEDESLMELEETARTTYQERIRESQSLPNRLSALRGLEHTPNMSLGSPGLEQNDFTMAEMAAGGSPMFRQRSPQRGPSAHRLSSIFGHESGPQVRLPADSDDDDEENAFAAEVSDSLLRTCREQQVQLRNLEEDLKKRERELALAKSQVNSASTLQDKMQEEIWSLEVKLQDAERNVSEQVGKSAALTNKTSKLRATESSQQDLIESLKAREVELQVQLKSIQHKYESELKNSRDTVKELEAHAAELTEKVIKSEEAARQKPQMMNVPDLAPSLNKSSNAFPSTEDFDKTPDNSPPVSPVKGGGLQSGNLASQTQGASLSQVLKLNNNLRTALQRERSEKLELKKQISKLSQENSGPSGSPAPATKKSGFRNFLKRPSKNYAAVGKGSKASKEMAHEDTTDDNFMSAVESFADDSAYSTAQDAFGADATSSAETETEYFSSVENQLSGANTSGTGFGHLSSNLSESDSDQATPTEETAPSSSHFYKRLQHMNANRVDVNDDSDSSANMTLRRKAAAPQTLGSEYMSTEELIERAKALDMVVLTKAEAETALISSDEIKLTKAEHEALLANANIDNLEKLSDVARKQDAHVLTTTEYQDLLNPSPEFISHRANALDLRVLTVKEFSSLTHPSPDAIERLAVEKGFVLLKNAELERLSNPSTKEVIELASARGLTALSEAQLTDLKAPSLETVKARAAELSYAVIPDNELKNLQSPSVDALRAKAKAHEMELIANSDLSELQNPTREQLIAKSSALGLSLLETSELESLRAINESKVRSQADTLGLKVLTSDGLAKLEAPSTEVITSHAKSHGLETVPVAELEEYTRLTTTAEGAKLVASRFNLEVVTQDELKNFKQPELSAVEKLAGQHDHSIIPTAKLESLESPTFDTLINHLKSHDMVAVSSSNHKEMSDTSLSKITKLAEQQHHVVIDREEYESLKQPSKDHLKTLAEAFNCALIAKPELESLKTPTIEKLQSECAKYSYDAIPHEEYESLLKPSLEQLESHLGALDLVSVPKTELKELNRRVTSPTIEEIEQAANAESLAIVDQTRLKELERMSNSPSQDELIAFAATYSCEIVPTSELASMKKQIESPERQYLEKKASLSGLALISTTELSALQKPTLETLKSGIEAKGFTALKNEEYERLLHPSLDDVTKEAKVHGSTVVNIAELEKLRAEPTVEEIAQHAATHKMAVISNEQLSQYEKPTLETLRARALQLEHEILPVSEVASLRKPTLGEVIKNATEYKYVTIPQDEYDALASPTLARTEEILKQQGQALSLDVLQVMAEQHNKALVTKDQNSASAFAEQFGLKCIEKETYQTLVSPPLDVLIKHLKQLDHDALPTEEHQSLLRRANSPTVAELEAFASQHNSKVIGAEKLANLEQRATNPSLDELTAMATAQQLSLVSQTEASQLKSPTSEFVQELASSCDLIAVPRSSIQGLTSEGELESSEISEVPEDFVVTVAPRTTFASIAEKIKSPTEDEIRAHAAGSQLAVLPLAELAELKHQVAHPSEQVVKDALAKQGQIAMEVSQERSLRQKAFNPTRQELDAHAVMVGLVVTEPEKIARLTALAENPPIAHIQQLAAKHNQSLVDENELVTLKEACNITLEKVKDLAKSFDQTVLSEQDAATLERRATAPTLAELEAAAESTNHVLLQKDYADELEQFYSNPNAASVQKQATAIGMEALPTEVLAELREKANNPDQKTLESGARRLGLALLPDAEYQDLLNQAQTGERLISEDKMAKQSVAARRARFENMARSSEQSNPSSNSQRNTDRMADTLRNLGLVPVPGEEYRRLLASQNVNDFTKADIIRGAKTFGLVAIPLDDYKQILQTNRSLKQVSTTPIRPSSSPSGEPTTPRKNQQPGSTAASPCKQDISFSLDDDSELTAVRKDYLEKLRQLVEDPTRDDVHLIATKLDLIVHNKDELDELISESVEARAEEQNLGPKLTNDEIMVKAAELGMVDTEDEDKIKVLASNIGWAKAATVEESLQIAKSHGLVENPTDEEIVARASVLGLSWPLSDADILAKAKYLGLTEPLSEDQIRVKAKSLGLSEPLSEDQILLKAKTLGLAKPLSDDEIVTSAKALGMVQPLSEAEFAHQAKAKGLIKPLSDSEVIQRAKKLGMVHASDVPKTITAPVAVPVPVVASPAVATLAAKPPVVVSPVTAPPVAAPPIAVPTIPASASTATPPESSIAAAPHRNTEIARDVTPTNRTSLSAQQPLLIGQGTATQSDTVPATPNSNFIRRPGPNNTHRPRISVAGVPIIASSTNDGNTPSVKAAVPSSTSRGALMRPVTKRRYEVVKSHTTTVAPSTPHTNGDNFIPAPFHIRQSPAVSVGTRSRDQSNAQTQTQPRTPTLRRGPPSLAESSGTGRQSSVGSFWEPPSRSVMMRYISQVVVGESAFKYVHGISFAGLNGRRHERFFWVHPYSMSLYWERENPVLLTGKVSSPRSAAIIDVKEIRDYNPLPVGLYYKSIVIKSISREVKITLPTQSRHRVWLCALQFLVQHAKESKRHHIAHERMEEQEADDVDSVLTETQ